MRGYVMRARTATEERHYAPGTFRERCTVCDKVAYPTRERAKQAAARISERTPMRAYQGRRCGWRHVTRRGASGARTGQRRAPGGHEDAWWAGVLSDPRADGAVIPSTGWGFRRRRRPGPAA